MEPTTLDANASDRVLRLLSVAEQATAVLGATLWLAAGEAPEWIATQMGHSSTEMLFRVYSRFVPNLTRRDGSAVDRLLTNAFGGNKSGADPPAPPSQPPPMREASQLALA